MVFTQQLTAWGSNHMVPTSKETGTSTTSQSSYRATEGKVAQRTECRPSAKNFIMLAG